MYQLPSEKHCREKGGVGEEKQELGWKCTEAAWGIEEV